MGRHENASNLINFKEFFFFFLRLRLVPKNFEEKCKENKL